MENDRWGLADNGRLKDNWNRQWGMKTYWGPYCLLPHRGCYAALRYSSQLETMGFQVHNYAKTLQWDDKQWEMTDKWTNNNIQCDLQTIRENKQYELVDSQ